MRWDQSKIDEQQLVKNEQIFQSLGNRFYCYALTWQLVRFYMN